MTSLQQYMEIYNSTKIDWEPPEEDHGGFPVRIQRTKSGELSLKEIEKITIDYKHFKDLITFAAAHNACGYTFCP